MKRMQKWRAAQRTAACGREIKKPMFIISPGPSLKRKEKKQ
jgi:hypothetical protein